MLPHGPARGISSTNIKIGCSRVLCSLAYQEQLSLTLAPQGPVPVVGPLPQTIPCGTFHIKAATFATESSLVVTLFITGVFSISTDATTVEIYATAAPITRVFSVAFPQQGRWLAMTEVSCFGCFAISATTPLIPVLRTERFSSLTRIRGNAIHSAQDEDPDPVVVRTPWWRRLSKRANT